MTADREQVRRDAMQRFRNDVNLSRNSYVPGTPEKYPLAEARVKILDAEAVLAELEQAERRIETLEEIDRQWEARWSSVPALVEALRRIADVGSEFAVNTDRLIARAALTVYEQSQGGRDG